MATRTWIYTDKDDSHVLKTKIERVVEQVEKSQVDRHHTHFGYDGAFFLLSDSM